MTFAAATSTDATAPAKSHYVVLDGLRGVAALMVVAFHLFEAYSGGSPHKQIINHGYLAVDFFFLLSGFVVAYAYDDRWGAQGAGMSQRQFYKRRLVRLQPMIVIGGLIGAALLAFQHSPMFPKLETVTAWQVTGVLLLSFVMIPLLPSAEIRGWGEIYPLNGPQWSLFYEYVANILYAVGLRKLPIRWLAVLVAISALALVGLLVLGPRGDVIGGWALDAKGVQIGLTRVMFPFFAGVLLMRLGRRIKIRHGFALCSLLLVIALALPRFGGPERLWVNGLYEAACVILLFPLIVAIGAGEKDVEGPSLRVARFFGDLSYPLYITHYPLIYVYTAWVVDHKIPAAQGALVGAGVFVAAVAIAWVSLKLYDEPVRRWLAGKLLRRG
ncbi:acyltransferase family protein [Caulobacter endophyticus]|uniref:Acyltransferase n=1 Tax=Caulobacter endophyticus TaxID=2172652 RepID=A0A2T9JLQ3_9CAUL|nr:acyltransferase [Caulobacter endophyticus]PVM84621.1 acyltransferase [Caulobacter endophyticus]